MPLLVLSLDYDLLGPFYQVLEPGDTSIPDNLKPLNVAASEIEVVGYELKDTAVTAGDFVSVHISHACTDRY